MPAPTPFIPTSSALEAAQVASLLPGPYDFNAYRCRSAAVATNKCPILPYRGVARTGVCLAVEVIMDAIAAPGRHRTLSRCGLRNLVRPEQMPFENVVKKQFDGGDYPESLRRAVAAIGLPAIRERQRRGEPDGRLIGVGFSIFCEQGAMGTAVLAAWGRPVVPGYEQATVRLTADGDLEIRVGTHSHGQGHETTLAQVAHEILGVDFDRIKVLQGDTLYSPFSTGTWGSRSMVMAGGAVAQASRMLAERCEPDRRVAVAGEPGRRAHRRRQRGRAGRERHATRGRARLVSAAAEPAARRRSGRPGSHRRLSSGARHGDIQLRHPCGAGRGRSGHRARSKSSTTSWWRTAASSSIR